MIYTCENDKFYIDDGDYLEWVSTLPISEIWTGTRILLDKYLIEEVPSSFTVHNRRAFDTVVKELENFLLIKEMKKEFR